MEADDPIQDRYRLIASLGTGGMAEVWRAQDIRLERDVAIKFLSESFRDDPENLVRFFSEAQSVARIQHPNVVTVLDFGQADGRPYLVMEHVPGGSLAQLCGTPVLPERALEIIGGAAAGAGAAHSLGIVHRDIKPANILLDAIGSPRVADFGIASSNGGESLTQTGLAVGSPHYLSPEQAQGRSTIPASDVYSLGVVLYELLTGVKPFDGANITAVAIAHVEQDPAPPSRHVPDLPPEIDALVLRCMAKDPQQRFPDGFALAESISAGTYAEAPAESADRDEVVGPPRRAVAIGTAAVAASLGLLAAVLFGGGGTERAGADEDGPAPVTKPTARAPADPTPAATSAPLLEKATTASGTTESASNAAVEEEDAEDEEPAEDDQKSGKSSRAEDEADAEPEAEPEPTEEPEPSPTPEPTPRQEEDEGAS